MILDILVCGGIIGGLGLLIVIMGKRYADFFRIKQADEILVFVGLLTLAIIVFVADFIKSFLSINFILLPIIVFTVYTVVRGIIQTENKKVKKGILKYSAIAVGDIGVFAIMVHFFGGNVLIAIPIGCLLALSEN